ncbi:hypothetical protein V0288_04860 [Pannus brasiliensis CCIBt3594]|uniref:Uncharacterized protein n=1 Tax=Pannus brasiliensis CCIBt3594 TaxID=1427578 RepID=A0AAW9QS21_9CHRO
MTIAIEAPIATRSSEVEIAACPTFFTPFQMHTREILQVGLNGWARWLRDHLISVQGLVEKYQTSMVVAMARAHYTDKFTFHDSDTIKIVTTATCIKGGVLLEMPSIFFAGDREVARVKIALRPVTITDTVSLGAKPSRLPEEVYHLFKPGEISRTIDRPVQTLLKQIEESGEGESIAEHRYSFTLHRHAMDFADQWAFMEASAYVGASRETLVLAKMSGDSRLKAGLSHPLQQFDIELHRPYFLFDEGVVDTKAYFWNGQLVFIHRLLGYGTGTEEVHATAIERMEI